MNKENNEHITLAFRDALPKAMQKRIRNGIESDEIRISVQLLPSGIINATEWLIPGAIGLFILKPYFEAFLKELGKEHYLKLKKWINKELIASRELSQFTITSSGLEKRVNQKNTQNTVFSVYYELKTGQKLKLMFDERLENDDWEKASSLMLDKVFSHYENYPNDVLTNEIWKLGYKSEKLFAIIDNSSKEWILMDEEKVIEVYFELKNE